MNKSESISELAAALAKAQGQITDAVRDSTNPFFKTSYADLSSVWAACRAPLSANGLAVAQMIEDTEHGMIMTTMLMHASGQWVASVLPVNPIKNDPQGIGSAITYMRRYSLAALVGVASSEDDDGNAATGNKPALKPAQQVRRTEPTTQPPADPPAPSGNGHTEQQPSAQNERVEAIARAKNAMADANAAMAKLEQEGASVQASDLHKAINDAKAQSRANMGIDAINAVSIALEDATSRALAEAQQ